MIERSIRRCGCLIVDSGGRRAKRDLWLHRVGPAPAGLEDVWGDDRPRFTVDLDKITSPTGFSYHPDGWHPYRAALEEALLDPELPYERSVLSEYYRRFRPTTVQEALLEDLLEPMEPLASWPPLLILFKHIWALRRSQVKRILARPGGEKGPRQQFGPQLDDEGERHRDRLLAAYDSIRTRGYDPEAFPDGRVTGYFLVRGENHRFVVLQGNHRLAAMRHVGIERVAASWHPGHPPVIHEHDLDRWTTDRGGVLPPAVAHRLFDKLFTERGDTKAKNLGLVNQSG
jgi:hypothetical protein